MASDPDAMWKPGFDPATSASASPPSRADRREPPAGTAAATGAAPIEFPDGVVPIEQVELAPPPTRGGTPSPSGSSPPRRRGRIVAVGVATVALAVGVAVVTADRRDPDPLASDLLAEPDARRLPDTVDELWSTRLPGTGNAIATELAIDGRDLVVVIVDNGSRDRAGVVGLDATTGEIRWRRSFAFSPQEVDIVGIRSGRVILQQASLSNTQVLALDTADGATHWKREPTIASTNVILDGTAVITQVLPIGNAQGGPLTGRRGAIFLDPRTGLDVGTVTGRVLATDLRGRWIFGDRHTVVSVDLSDGWNEPELISTDGVTFAEGVGAVGGRFLRVGGRGDITELRPDTAFTISDLTVLASARAGDVPLITSLLPTGESTFVGVGDGRVVGGRLDEDRIEVEWSTQALVRNFGRTERGVLLSLSEAGSGFVDGVDFTVVDAVTGERLASTGPAPSDDQMPLIVGDGFVLTHVGVTATERIGYDIVGSELWRLPATGTLEVGDEIVVTLANTSSGYRITAYGATIAG